MHAVAPVHAAREGLLRVFVGGSAGAGKSTLIGRLARETAAALTGKTGALRPPSAPRGGVDARHVFEIAGVSGQESDARNVMSLASNCDLAVIVVDARGGIGPKARLHAAIAHLIGIRHFVLGVNKLDLSGWDRTVYERVAGAFRDFAGALEIERPIAVPLSALNGDNLAELSANTPWYGGPTLLGHLTGVEAPAVAQKKSWLGGEVDAERANGLAAADQFKAHLIWTDEQPLLPHREYVLHAGGRSVAASVTAIKYRLDIVTGLREPAHTLRLNDVGVCDVATSPPVAIDAFAEGQRTGCFVLKERHSGTIAGAGIVDFALRRGVNVKEQPLALAKGARAALKVQKPCVLWFTGLSGAGKSTIANLVEAELAARGRHTYLLDGDNVRRGLNKDIGFTDADRVENIRRVGEVAKLFVDAGLIVLCSFISPFQAERAAIRRMLEPGEFFEIFVSAPLAVCEKRDPKGLYAKARKGLLPSFTGIDSPYEPPDHPDLLLDTAVVTAKELANRVIDLLRSRGVIGADRAPVA